MAEWGNPLLGHTLDGVAQDAERFAYFCAHGRLSPSSATGRVHDVHAQRRFATTRYAFGCPDDRALELVAAAGPVIEVGAGTGYWARCLAERGVDVIATDELAAPFERWFPEAPRWHPVQRVDARLAAAAHADRTLLMVWPPMSSMAIDALLAYEAHGGQRAIYVGEGTLGCTADETFTSYTGIDWWDDDDGPRPATPWRVVEEHRVPQWPGINDWLYVLERSAAAA